MAWALKSKTHAVAALGNPIFRAEKQLFINIAKGLLLVTQYHAQEGAVCAVVWTWLSGTRSCDCREALWAGYKVTGLQCRAIAMQST